MRARVKKAKTKTFQKKPSHTQISWPVSYITMSRMIDYKTGQLSKNRRDAHAGSTHLKPIIGPGTEFHDTCLFVEGKIFDVNLTGRLVNCRRLPLHQPVPPEGGLGGEGHLKVSIGTEMFQAMGFWCNVIRNIERNDTTLYLRVTLKL